MQGWTLVLYYAILIVGGLLVAAVFYAIRGGRRPGLAVGLSLVALGLLFVLALGRSQFRLALFGAHAEGRIVEVYRVRGGIRPVVEFMTPEEDTITFDGDSVGRRDYYTAGQTVHVRYLRSDPEFAEVQSWWSLWQPMLIGSTVTGALPWSGG
jgi:hypothetical protein